MWLNKTQTITGGLLVEYECPLAKFQGIKSSFRLYLIEKVFLCLTRLWKQQAEFSTLIV